MDNPGDEEAGTVADLSPFGKVAKGELITLRGLGRSSGPGDRGAGQLR